MGVYKHETWSLFIYFYDLTLLMFQLLDLTNVGTIIFFFFKFKTMDFTHTVFYSTYAPHPCLPLIGGDHNI